MCAEPRQVIRVAVVSDYRLIVEAVRNLLWQYQDIEVVAEGRDGFDAVEVSRSCRPDVLLLQPSSLKKDGLDTIEQVAALGLGTKIVLLPLEITTCVALRLLRAGAHGLLSKDETAVGIAGAIRQVVRGGMYLSEEVQRLCAERYILPAQKLASEANLSNREFQVMRLLALGQTNREIAETLSVGVKTVDAHRGNLMRKLGLRNNADITRYAIQFGLIEI